MLETTTSMNEFDCDDNSDVSSLQCGSIPPHSEYDPARDPRHFTFIPPVDIVVKGKVEVPEWLRIDCCDIPCRSVSDVISPARSSNEDELRRQLSWGSRLSKRQKPIMILPYLSSQPGDDALEQRWKEGSLDLFRGAKSTTSTLRTSPTHVSDDADGWSVLLEIARLQQVPRLSIFQRRKRKISLRPPRGCLT